MQTGTNSTPMSLRAGVATLLFAVSFCGGAMAQTGDLAGLIPNFFDRTVKLFPAGHEAHFVDSSDAIRQAGLLINSSIVSQLSTFPLGTSSGGFTFEFDEELGIFERTTTSFGSLFAERGETLGKGRWNFGFSVFSVEYDAVDDLDLRNGDLNFTLTHLDTNHDGTTVETFFEGDLIDLRVSLRLDAQTSVFFGSYGVTDRFDVAVAVPFLSVGLDAQLDEGILRLASEGFSIPPFHRFTDGADSAVDSISGSASGVGDILLRGKYRLARNETSAAAVALDVRLPTGAEEDLLGTGALRTKLFFIGNTRFGKFAPHVNVGYTFSSSESDTIGKIPDEINFTTGFAIAVTPRVTTFVDVVWRTLLDATQLSRREVDHLYRRFNETTISRTTRPVLQVDRDDLNIAFASVGIKVNLVGELLLTANLSFSLTDEGLRDEDLVPYIGIDYSF